jgi:hypothetical protein
MTRPWYQPTPAEIEFARLVYRPRTTAAPRNAGMAPVCPLNVWEYLTDSGLFRPYRTAGGWNKRLWRPADNLPVFRSRAEFDAYAKRHGLLVGQLAAGVFVLKMGSGL